MSRILDIEAIPEVPRFDPRGPVGILITLRNRSHMNIEFDFPYPAPSELSLTSQQARLRTEESEVDVNREAIPRRLAPGQALRTRHELRRYFHLPDRGRFDVEVRLDITVQPIDATGEPKGPVEVIRWQRTVGIVIEPGVGSGIEHQLQQFAQDMRCEDEQRRAEAVEAFAHIGSEKALPYLREALELRELRAEALRGLARIGSPASLALIEDALGDSDLPTLQVGLSSLRAAGKPIQVETLRTLVSTGDPAVQYACLEHLLGVGTYEHAAAVGALGDSPNSAVSELAHRFLSRFP
jgi:hypothetical protein